MSALCRDERDILIKYGYCVILKVQLPVSSFHL